MVSKARDSCGSGTKIAADKWKVPAIQIVKLLTVAGEASQKALPFVHGCSKRQELTILCHGL